MNLRMIILIIGLVYCDKIICQDTDKHHTLDYLDYKSGILEFKINDPIEKWESALFADPNVAGLYKYTGSCCKKLLEGSVTRILLFFKDKKLKSINFITIDYLPLDQNGAAKFEFDPNRTYMAKDLINLFGQQTGFDYKSDTKGTHLMYQWVSKKIVLNATVTLGSTFDGKMSSDITVYDKDYFFQDIMSKDGF